jgi:hypothetical protein
MKKNLELGQIETFAPSTRILPRTGEVVNTFKQVPNGTEGEGVKLYQWVVNSLTGESVILLPIEKAKAFIA